MIVRKIQIYKKAPPTRRPRRAGVRARRDGARWWSVSLPVRIGTLILAFLLVAAGGAFLVVHYFLYKPATEVFHAGPSGQVNIMMQEDPQNTVSTHPDWVSYFIKNPTTGKWDHTTIFQVPANTQVNMTILGYDGCTPLRNPFWGKVTGTIGGYELVDGKKTRVLNSYSGCNVGHTFSIPGIGLNVPMGSPGLSATLCGTSPCTSGPHQTMQFSFITPKATGTYFWQCRIPCGGGFIDGFGGPMQTIGFMTGNMEVVS
jgi:hypothetical protein